MPTDTLADVNEILSIATIRPEVVQNKFCPFSPGFQYSADGSDPIASFQSLGMVYVSYSTLSGWPLGQLGAISRCRRKRPTSKVPAQHFTSLSG